MASREIFAIRGMYGRCLSCAMMYIWSECLSLVYASTCVMAVVIWNRIRAKLWACRMWDEYYRTLILSYFVINSHLSLIVLLIWSFDIHGGFIFWYCHKILHIDASLVFWYCLATWYFQDILVRVSKLVSQTCTWILPVWTAKGDK